MSRGRAAYLRRLLPYLRNQSEDCLYLNIYAPDKGYPMELASLPVMVFIHGESFSWNSGNPYDGSVIASYADVIVVTINFRLGIFGFLKQSLIPGPKSISNLGLMDQVAALKWIKDNIAKFGGDPTLVTLFGHHTGAVAINYLMMSPLTGENALFRRAILMSGSALANWAETKHPETILGSIAEALRCPLNEPLECLRKKRAEDLLAESTLYEWAPSVDGIVVPNHPKGIMSTYTHLFTSYDMLCGTVEDESYHLLDGLSLLHGMLDEERDALLKEFFRNNYEMHPDIAKTKAMKEYNEHKRGNSAAEDARDATIGILSDSMVIAPLLQTAIYHSTHESKVSTYVYVFTHRSKNGEFPNAERSIHGEDLPYVFGVPLEGPSNHFQGTYSAQEVLLSEVIMSMWTNFAKTGNPNGPKRYNFVTLTSREWAIYDNITWPLFDPHLQTYYRLGIPPGLGHKYKDHKVRFWNYLPKFLSDLAESPDPRPTWIREQGSSTYPKYGPYFPRTHRTTKKPIYGIVSFTEHDQNVQQIDDDAVQTTELIDAGQPINTASSFALSVIIVIGICFLIINVISFFIVYYQKRNLKKERSEIEMNNRFRIGTSPSLPDLDIEINENRKRAEIRSILKSNERLYDAVKKKPSQHKWTSMYNPGSSSTVTIDPHTKVAQWMRQDSMKIVHNPKSVTDKSSETDKFSTITTPRASLKTKKISVAVDATPSSRGASVLKQTPIELTKSMDSGKKKLGTLRPVLTRFDALSDDTELSSTHSRTMSDPVHSLPDSPHQEVKSLSTFEPIPKDINVTCREDTSDQPMTPEEALDNIRRRNFPKVLPDFPDEDTDGVTRLKRMSLPQPGEIHKEIIGKKIPPPPPPRVSTLARKPATSKNTVPNFMTTHKELGESSEASQQVNLTDKPKKRPEPRVIIKPSLTDPNLKKSTNNKIPRVTHQQNLDRPSHLTNQRPQQVKKTEDRGGGGIKQKGNPRSKTTSTETSGTSGSSVSSASTVRKSDKS
ncbi:neuroligin-4, X-linked-like isoform X2 [Rhodnius prolixus]